VSAAPPTLVRALGPLTATAIVAGTIIGTGIFLKPAVMAQGAGSEALVLVAWIVAGLLSLAGALTYAELGALMPEAGGEYVYLREAYGRLPAFLYGWMRFFIGSAGSIAAYAVGSATFLGAVFDTGAYPGGGAGLAVSFIALFTLSNTLALTFGARVQLVLTTLKVLAILGLCGFLLVLGEAPPPSAPEPGFLGLASFSTAVLAALWAFDGWNNLAMVGGEIRDPQRNLPLALIAGMALVAALYLLSNAAYFNALDYQAVSASYSSAHKDALPVATNALSAVTGGAATPVVVVSILFVVSALGAMNGSILTGSRVPYALARDGLFPRGLARLTRRQVPALAVVTQGVVAVVLALSGTFDQLTDAVVFASWIFYGLSTGAVLILRRRGRTAAYRTPLYPVLPVVFLIVTALLLVNTIISMPELTALGLGIIALGVPAFFFATRRR
jgi:APA family basic amino acid/polyamine antiporter